MRTKSRGVIVTQASTGTHQDYCSNNGNLYGGVVSWSSPIVEGKIETITYDDSKRSGRIRTTRYCDHITVKQQNVPVTESYFLYPGTFYRKVKHNVNMGHVDHYLPLPSVSSYHAEALQFFKAGCQDQHLDLGANLFELGQVKTLIPSIYSSLKSLESVSRTVTPLSVKTIARGARESANLHLAYAFGIMPLINDVRSLIASVKGLQDRITWLRKNSGRPVRVDFSKDLSTTSLPADSVVLDNENERVTVEVKAYRCTYHAFATLTYDVSSLSDIELGLRLMTRTLGLDKPLNTAWELLPWSFVVDWIFAIGQWLDRITPAITLPVQFQDLGYSIKVERDDLCCLVRKNPRGGSGRTEAGVQRTRYYRCAGLPISFSSLSETDVGLRQLALSLSLLAQRAR